MLRRITKQARVLLLAALAALVCAAFAAPPVSANTIYLSNNSNNEFGLTPQDQDEDVIAAIGAESGSPPVFTTASFAYHYDGTGNASGNNHGSNDLVSLFIDDNNLGTPSTGNGAIYFSQESNVTLNSIAFSEEDLIFFDGTNFSKYWDGTDHGIGANRVIDALWIDLATGDIYFSMDADNSVPVVADQDEDIIKWACCGATSQAFSVFYNGTAANNHGATNLTGLSIDLVNGILYLALESNVNNLAGSGVNYADEDVVRVKGTITTGAFTAGTPATSYNTFFDGSAAPGGVGNRIDGVHVPVLAVPEPGTLALMGLGLVGLHLAGRRAPR